jgi:hypothetical protein
MRFLLLTALIVAPCLAEELPNQQLLPTTKAIHAKIAAKADPKAEEMKGYTEPVPLSEGGTIQLLPIPAGKFKIGSPDGEAKRQPDEGPQKEIAIEPFWMAKVETAGRKPGEEQSNTRSAASMAFLNASKPWKRRSLGTSQRSSNCL